MNAPVKLAVLGDPLAFTLSPELHRAGLESLGIPGESRALRVPPGRLGEALADLAAAGARGANLTRPHKEAALEHLTAVSSEAARARSVNTVLFDRGAVRGETTDGPGFVDLLRDLGREPGGAAIVLLGAGGAARSLALAALGAGAPSVTAWTRRPDAAAAAWRGIPGAVLVPWMSGEARASLARARVVVNATPLTGADLGDLLDQTPRDALAVDLGYGREITEWVRAARDAGRAAVDGLGLLVFQARRSLSLWLGREVPLEPLARAVGWPR